MKAIAIRISLSLLLVILLPAAAPAARPFEGDTGCATNRLAHVSRQDLPLQERRELLQQVLTDVESGNCSLDARGARDMAFHLFQLATQADDDQIRFMAGRFLQRSPHPELAEPLLDRIERPARLQPGARDVCIDVLASLRDRRAEPYLLARLRGPGDGPFFDTLQALAEIGTPATADTLAAMLDDPASGLGDSYRARIPAAIADIRRRVQAGFYAPFALDGRALDRLRRHGVTVTLEQKNEMFEFYDGDYPYVTTDAVHHTAMILVRAALEGLEQQGLRNDLGAFCAGMAAAGLEQAEQLRSRPALHELALVNAAFFAVPARLCGAGAVELPDGLAGRVATELVLIEAEAGVSYSPLLGRDEDYARYRPRGRFAGQGATVEDYYRAVTWLGRAAFPLDDDRATAQSLLMLEALDARPDLRRRWEELDGLLTLLFGRADDGSFGDYRAAVQGTGRGVIDLLCEPDGLADFRARVDLPEQAVNTAYIPWPASREWRRRTSGLRVPGQRYTPDSHVFQRLMDDGQWPVSGLHVAAGMLGSGRAARILEDAGMKAAPDGVALSEPPAGLVEQTLHCLGALLEPEARAGDLYRSEAWQDKQLNAVLGGWAEIRHATAPYVKDATVYLGCSAMTDRIHGYVEPYPEFYRRLKELAAGLHAMLADRGVYARMAAARTDSALAAEHLDDGKPDRAGRRRFVDLDKQAIHLGEDHLPQFMDFLDRLIDLSLRELAGEDQTVADGQFLKHVGWTLKKLALNRNSMLRAEEPMSRVVDVATEYQSGTCLEVAVSRPLAVYVIVEHAGERIVCRGAVYNYHEFTWPAADRLTDERWRTLDNRLDVANRPPWLITRPAFRLTRPVQEKELDALQRSRIEPRRHWSRIFERDPAAWDGAAHLAATTAGADDIARLAVLADMDPGNPGVTMYARDRLLALGGEAGVEAYFAAMKTATLRRGRLGREAVWMNLTDLYRHLGARGREGLGPLLALRGEQAAIARYVGLPDATLPHPLETHFQLALIQARAGRPARWTWRLAGACE